MNKQVYFPVLIIIATVTFVIGIPAAELQTTAEITGFQELTRHGELMEYLREVTASSKLVSMSSMGTSVEDRDIPALFFTRDRTFGTKRTQKPVVMIFCQQHGNEPSGKEAALILARELRDAQKHFLQSMDIILIPQMNPDGSEKDERRNANDEDLNRSHVALIEPETAAIHRVFREWMPEVTLDVHEYNAITESWVDSGYVKDADEQLGGVTNVNISTEIMAFTRERMIPAVGAKLEAAGYTFHRYIVGSPFEDGRLRYSTTAINDGRQSLGIYNTFAFILEGKRYGDVTNRLRRRTEAQLAAMIAFLEVVAEHQKSILEITREAREQLLRVPSMDPEDMIHIQMDYFPDSTRPSVKFPIFNLHTWRPEIRDLTPFEPLVMPKKSIWKSHGYILAGGDEKIVNLLSRHMVIMFKLKQPIEVKVEGYRIVNFTTRHEEEMEMENVDAHPFTETKTLAAESIIIPINQPAGNLLPLMLEPHSSFSIVTEYSGRRDNFSEYVRVGEVYPIYRLMEPVDPNLLDPLW
ncbi:MAG: succinylglutamate desuccinylase/aspartoacylase family protein [Fidelibacterota bacterium]|nr:MAG: succinylglutamate desuccinylase/aspartoacylase family protein [Candidatus Neomarinimicrobiota bacterium]